MSPTILLVDDHRMIREGLRAILESNPKMNVIDEADNGRQAVALAANLNPDVIIMDVSMPEMNGVEATRRIKAHNPEARVIGLSAYHDKQFVLAMMEAGASGYVLKDAAADELKQAIKLALRGQTYFSPTIISIIIESRIPPPAPFQPLTNREREILMLLAIGTMTPQIAAKLGIQPQTVRTHRRNILKKLGLSNISPWASDTAANPSS